MEVLKKAGSSLLLRMGGGGGGNEGGSEAAPDGMAPREEVKEDAAPTDKGGTGLREPGPAKPVRARSIRLLGRLDRGSSWMLSGFSGSRGGGGGGALGMEAGGAPRLRSQEARLRRLQRRVFPERDEMPGGCDWTGGILLASGGGARGGLLERAETGSGLAGAAGAAAATRGTISRGGAGREAGAHGLVPVPRELARRVVTGHPNLVGGDLRLPCKVVRVFVTGSGRDSEYERDAFAAFCVPYLREVCRAEGLELAVMDWRSGVNEVASQAALDLDAAGPGTGGAAGRWQARALNCNAAAAASVVAFLGDKYGPRPLPARLPRSLFESCAQALQDTLADADEADLLRQWYELDENQRPAAYVLRAPDALIDGFDSALGSAHHAAVRWTEQVRPALSSLLRRGLALAQAEAAALAEISGTRTVGASSQRALHGSFGLSAAEATMLSAADKHVRAALADQEAPVGSRPILVLRDFFNGAATDHAYSTPEAIRNQRQQQQELEREHEQEHEQEQQQQQQEQQQQEQNGSFRSAPGGGQRPARRQHNVLGDLFANPVYSDAGEQSEPELAALCAQLGALKGAVQRDSQGPILHFDVDWEGRFDPIRSKTHACYVRSAVLEVTREIEKAVATRQGFRPDAAFEEAQAHQALAYELLGRGFVGREELCDKVHQAMVEDKAVVVHGPRGTGKTCLLAKVAVQSSNRTSGGGDQGGSGGAGAGDRDETAVVVTRFLGTTQRSETVPQLLQNLAMQICAAYGSSDVLFGQGQQMADDLSAVQHERELFGDDNYDLINSSYLQQQQQQQQQRTPVINGDHTKIVTAFWDALGLATKARPLHLVLDGLDRLVDARRPCTLSWLPSADSLPAHVHIVVSTTTNGEEEAGGPSGVGNGGGELELEPPAARSPSKAAGGKSACQAATSSRTAEGVKCTKLLAALVKKGYASHVSVGCVPKDGASTVLDGWLKKDGRALQREQRLALLAIVQRAKSPSMMLLRVLYNESLRWRSQQLVPADVLAVAHDATTVRHSNDCSAALKLLFDRVEREQGAEPVRAVLALLLTSRDGLSLMELQDLLSADAAALGGSWAFRGLSAPPTVPRVPAALVAGVVDALDAYWSPIVRDQCGRFVLFNHDVESFAKARYLPTAAATFAVARRLADYFSNSVRMEDVVIDDLDVRLGSNRFLLAQPVLVPVARGGSSQGRTERRVVVANGETRAQPGTEQPLHAVGKPSAVANRRRLRELPPALLLSQRFAACLREITRPAFLRAMVEDGAFDELVALLGNKALPNAPFRAALVRALSLSKPAILANPEQLEEQLWGRLDPVFGAAAQRASSDGVSSSSSSSGGGGGGGGGGAAGLDEDVVALLGQLDALRTAKPGLHGRWNNVLEPVNSPLVRTMDNHKRPVTALCGAKLRNGSRVVASASKGPVLKLWDQESGNLLANCEGHRGGIAALTAVELWDGRALIACGTGSKVLLWDAETATLHAVCDGGHAMPISSLTTVERASDDARLLVSGSADASVAAWEAKTGALCWTSKTLGAVTALCATPELLAAAGKPDDACVVAAALIKDPPRSAGSCGGSCAGRTTPSTPATPLSGAPSESDATRGSGVLQVFAASTGGLRATVHGHCGRINAVCAMSLAGDTAGTGDGAPTVPQDLVEQDIQDQPEHQQQQEHQMCILASAGSDGVVLLSDAASGTVRATCAGHAGPVLSLCVLNLPGGRIVVCSGGEDGALCLWDARTGRQVAIQPSAHGGAVRAVNTVQLSDGRVFVASAGDDAVVCLWDGKTLGAVWRGASHTSAVSGLTVVESADGTECVLSCSLDKTLKAWDALSTMKATVLVPPCSPRPPSGAGVVATSSHAITTTTMSAAAAARSGSHSLLKGLGVSSNGLGLASSGAGGRGKRLPKWTRGRGRSSSARVLPTSQLQGKGGVVPSSEAVSSGEDLAGSCNASWVTVVAACPSHDERSRRHLVASGSIDNVVRVFDAGTGRKAFSLRGHDDAVHAIVSAGDCIISASADGTACVWSAKTGKFKVRCEGNGGKVRALAALAGPEVRGGAASKRLPLFASGSDDGTVKVWSFAGTLLATCEGHTDSVRALCAVEAAVAAPSQAGAALPTATATLIASGSADFSIKLWTTAGEMVRDMPGHDGRVNTLKFARGAGVLASGSSDHTLRFWDVNTGGCLSVAEAGSSDGLSVFKTEEQAARAGATGVPDSSSVQYRWFFSSASFTTKTFTFWDAKTGQPVSVLRYPTPALSSATWSENGVLLFGCQDGRLCVCDNQMAASQQHSAGGGAPLVRPSGMLGQHRARPLLLRKTTAPSLLAHDGACSEGPQSFASVDGDSDNGERGGSQHPAGPKSTLLQRRPSLSSSFSQLMTRGIAASSRSLSATANSTKTNAIAPSISNNHSSSNNNRDSVDREYDETRSPPPDTSAHQAILMGLDSFAYLR